MDPGLNSLLQWGIENSAASNTDNTLPPTSVETSKSRGLNADALAHLMGGPSDADLMRESMTVIQNPAATLSSKTTAFDNLEQLVESIDNANNITPLGLWEPARGAAPQRRGRAAQDGRVVHRDGGAEQRESPGAFCWR